MCVLDEPKLCAMNPIQSLENISLTTIVGFQSKSSKTSLSDDSRLKHPPMRPWFHGWVREPRIITLDNKSIYIDHSWVEAINRTQGCT